MKEFDPESQLSKSELPLRNLNTLYRDYIEDKSIFGIDIYRYSEYPEEAQVYVPVLFNSIYRLTIDSCLKKEKFFFSNYASTKIEFNKKFISTGDGGFQIFDNPIQSIIFGAYFELNVRRFNSGSLVSKLNKNLFKMVKRIELRYCITNDKVFNYNNNYYGTGIINNARILSKDNLNRMLIDVNTLRWFDNVINTIENLMEIRKNDFLKIKYFKSLNEEDRTDIFTDYEFDTLGVIRTLDILKIGSIKSKNSELEIYNLKIQFLMTMETSLTYEKDYAKFLFTIGNLNTHGIE